MVYPTNHKGSRDKYTKHIQRDYFILIIVLDEFTRSANLINESSRDDEVDHPIGDECHSAHHAILS